MLRFTSWHKTWPHSFKFKALDPHAAYLEDSLLSSQSIRLLIHPSLNCPRDPFYWASPQVKGRVEKVAGAGILCSTAPLLKLRGRFFPRTEQTLHSEVGSASSEVQREWGCFITVVNATARLGAQQAAFPVSAPLPWTPPHTQPFTTQCALSPWASESVCPPCQDALHRHQCRPHSPARAPALSRVVEINDQGENVQHSVWHWNPL